MDNPSLFRKRFMRALDENTTAGAGVGGTMTDLVGNSDTYAAGDARVPHSLFGGKLFRREHTKRKKKRRTKKNKR